MMRRLAALSILASAALWPQTAVAQITPSGLWQPSADYVTPGQDEPGYRSWYMASPRHQIGVTSFNAYLTQYEVSGIVPTWQLLRTASSWQRCGAQPFEVPPIANWPHIVQTLRYLREHVIPVVGPVEPVSAYRNPMLNVCAGGAPESAHRHFLAVDLVPLRPIARETMMRDLCAAHARRGDNYHVGLGFYAFHRFHIDSMKFRKWGVNGTPEASPCAAPLPRPDPPPLAPAEVPATTPVATPVAQPQPAPETPAAPL